MMYCLIDKSIFIKRKFEKVKSKNLDISYDVNLFNILSEMYVENLATRTKCSAICSFFRCHINTNVYIVPYNDLKNYIMYQELVNYKAENYGKYFLHEIQKYVEAHSIDKSSISNRKFTKITKRYKNCLK